MQWTFYTEFFKNFWPIWKKHLCVLTNSQTAHVSLHMTEAQKMLTGGEAEQQTEEKQSPPVQEPLQVLL